MDKQKPKGVSNLLAGLNRNPQPVKKVASENLSETSLSELDLEDHLDEEEIDEETIEEKVAHKTIRKDKKKLSNNNDAEVKDPLIYITTQVPQSIIERMEKLKKKKTSEYVSKAELIRAGILMALEEQEEIAEVLEKQRNRLKKKRTKQSQ